MSMDHRRAPLCAALINAAPREWRYVFPPHIVEAFRGRVVPVGEPDIAVTSPDAESDRPPSLARTIDEWSGEPIRVVISTWGAQPLEEEVLSQLPELSLILHAAGSVKSFVTDALADRGVPIVSAARINARPVAEFALGVILTSLKNVFAYHDRFRRDGERAWRRYTCDFNGGYYGTRVGLLGFGLIARLLVELLRPFDIEVYVADPYLSADDAASIGVRPATTDWIVEHCDVISLHHADVPANWNTLNGDNLPKVRPNARIINTARGRLVDHDALVRLLRDRPDVTAYLDVTHPEPPEENSPLYRLPNCILTPHIAGSIGREVERMSLFCLEQLDRWIEGLPTSRLDGLVAYSELEMRA